MPLIIVDCEAFGGSPVTGELTEFGAVDFTEYNNTGRWETFHGIIIPSRPSVKNPAVPEPIYEIYEAPNPRAKEKEIFTEFDKWLKSRGKGRPIFISDNVAFDWMWICCGFWRALGRNPFGHSGRRISDFYAGLTGDWSNTQRWKRLRITPHTHNPIEDCMGNAEALARIFGGER